MNCPLPPPRLLSTENNLPVSENFSAHNLTCWEKIQFKNIGKKRNSPKTINDITSLTPCSFIRFAPHRRKRKENLCKKFKSSTMLYQGDYGEQ